MPNNAMTWAFNVQPPPAFSDSLSLPAALASNPDSVTELSICGPVGAQPVVHNREKSKGPLVVRS